MGPSFTAASIAFNVLELLGTITWLAFYLCASSAHAMCLDAGWLLVRLTTRFDYINCVLVPLSSILIILCAISSGVCLRAVDVRLRALVIPPAFKNLSSYSAYLPGSILIITGVVIHSLILLLALKLKHVKRHRPSPSSLYPPRCCSLPAATPSYSFCIISHYSSSNVSTFRRIVAEYHSDENYDGNELLPQQAQREQGSRPLI